MLISALAISFVTIPMLRISCYFSDLTFEGFFALLTLKPEELLDTFVDMTICASSGRW